MICLGYVLVLFFCFFKQKTAYEMRISDWSSDVCSSDLDTDPKRNRWFIQEALKAAVAKLANDYSVEPADRPELDHDTQNEAGMVEITAAIFDKILHCSTFVADLTPIARTRPGKAIPNPNVSIELGWALKMPQWPR